MKLEYQPERYMKKSLRLCMEQHTDGAFSKMDKLFEFIYVPAGIILLKFNNWNNRIMLKIC